MAKTWVLETQTKGTGATMVPLERVLRKGASEAVPGFAIPDRKRPAEEPTPHSPHEFRIIDLMTRAVLADRVDARGAVAALHDVRSIVDVSVYVWEPIPARWRKLTFGEAHALWECRGKLPEPGPAQRTEA
jgi:hypothetical protein